MDFLLLYIFVTMFYHVNMKIDIKPWGDRESIKNYTLRDSP